MKNNSNKNFAKVFQTAQVGVLALVLSACAVNFEPPEDEAASACRKKTIGTVTANKTPISCEVFEENGVAKVLVAVKKGSWKGMKTDAAGNQYVEIVGPATSPEPSNLPGLIVMVEVGTFEANQSSAANTPFSGMMTSKVPVGIQQNIRMFMSNFTKAFLETTIDRSGKKYGHIYFVKSDLRLKEIFLQTLKKATKLHPHVDLLMVGHGGKGEFFMNKDLKSNAENLTGQDLITFSQSQLAGYAGRVRYIFQTHCFMRSSAGTKMAMFDSYKTAFPNAKFYGGYGVNSFPLHRDVVAFEKYYDLMGTQEAAPFEKALLTAQDFIEKTLDGYPRQYIVFPSIKGRGCITAIGFDKCKSMAQATGYVFATPAVKLDSRPHLGKGIGVK